LKRIAIIIGLIALVSINGFSQKKFKTTEDSVSYAIGLDIVKSIKGGHVDTLLNAKILAQAIIDGLATKPIYKIDPEKAKTLLSDYFKTLQNKQNEIRRNKSKQNIEIEKQFLEANAKKDSIITLSSGLQYKIIKKGEGEKPTINDYVICHYKGSFINGKVFDSSYDRNEPATFPITGGVINGWSEALQLMSVGSKWQIFVPYNLAYGEEGMTDIIEPYQTLIFDIELLSVQKSQSTNKETDNIEPVIDEIPDSKE